MTALAFLFAVFLAEPCPFYILDEVEAALDDLNLDRFLALLRRYCDRAQFIVITHQKRTMEAADWLYGVSMGAGRRLEGDLAPPRPRRTAPAGRTRSPRSPERRPLLSSRRRVPRDWSDLFITAERRRGVAPSAAAEEAPRRRGLLRRLRESMARTRQALGSEIQATLFATLDEHTWERLEEALIMADVGARTTAAVVQTLEQEATAASSRGARR